MRHASPLRSLASTTALLLLALSPAACGGDSGMAPTDASAPADGMTPNDGGAPDQGGGADAATSGCTTEGQALVDAINAVRVDNGLAAIPTSPSLCFVAHTHSVDLVDNQPDASADCNLHSWSDQGAWTPCCYTADHAAASCMHVKPSELTDYTASGFEVSAVGPSTAEGAVALWMNSAGHRSVILNQGSWSGRTWRALGGGYAGGHWNAWFGDMTDPDGP